MQLPTQPATQLAPPYAQNPAVKRASARRRRVFLLRDSVWLIFALRKGCSRNVSSSAVKRWPLSVAAFEHSVLIKIMLKFCLSLACADRSPVVELFGAHTRKPTLAMSSSSRLKPLGDFSDDYSECMPLPAPPRPRDFADLLPDVSLLSAFMHARVRGCVVSRLKFLSPLLPRGIMFVGSFDTLLLSVVRGTSCLLV